MREKFNHGVVDCKTHLSRSGAYNLGCRCDTCREAKNAPGRARRVRNGPPPSEIKKAEKRKVKARPFVGSRKLPMIYGHTTTMEEYYRGPGAKRNV